MKIKNLKKLNKNSKHGEKRYNVKKCLKSGKIGVEGGWGGITHRIFFYPGSAKKYQVAVLLT